MTAETQMWTRLAEPFPDSEVKQRPGAAKYDHKPNCQGARCNQSKDPNAHIQLSYIDARAVMQRLDNVVTPAGWEFTSSVIPGTDIVHGRLVVQYDTLDTGVTTQIVREDYGYPNSDRDEEPIKAASSDALKRCAVMFGIGRHLYEDNKPQTRSAPPQRPMRPAADIQRTDPDLDVHEARQRAAVFSSYVPEEPEDLFPPIGGAIPAVVPTDTCPLHGTKWGGSPGDLFHGPKGVTPNGYCRHPDNVKKARAS
jgi:hypothetical protein